MSLCRSAPGSAPIASEMRPLETAKSSDPAGRCATRRDRRQFGTRGVLLDEGCLSQSIELSGRVLRIRDVRFVASAAQHAPDPRMEQQDSQAFCAMENSLVLKKREPLRLGIRLRTSGRSFPTIRAPMCQAR